MLLSKFLSFIIMDRSTSTSATVPLAILAGFAFIAIAIYFSGIGARSVATTPAAATAALESGIPPVGDSDYIRGNPNAPIMIVEYSDYDCPYCKIFHETMQQLMTEYALLGKVAWVYRQMPIVELHPNAQKISEAALCVGEVAGNEAFWTFSDLVFGERLPEEPTNMTRLYEYAERAGADTTAFRACYDGGRWRERVAEGVEAGFAAGVTGTPHSVLLVGNQQAVIEGAQSYATIKEIVDNLISQLEGTPPPTPLPQPATDE